MHRSRDSSTRIHWIHKKWAWLRREYITNRLVFKRRSAGKLSGREYYQMSFAGYVRFVTQPGRNKIVGRISQRRNPTYSLNKLSDYGACAPNLTCGYEMKKILDSLPRQTPYDYRVRRRSTVEEKSSGRIT